jgi:hypothetical protein
MKTKPRFFLKYWILTLATFVIVICVFNVVVDPYRVFGMPLLEGFNARKSAAWKQEWLYKVYEANRIEPKTVLLGSSRVAVGMDSQSPAWPESYFPVYNLGLPAGGPYASFRYLQNLMLVRAPDLVIVGLDFEYFLDTLESQHSAVEPFESRLAVKSDGTLNRSAGNQRILDFTQFTLSFDSLSDSLSTVAGNLRGNPADSIAGNVPDTQLFQDRVDIGTFPIMEWTNVINVRRLRLSGNRNRFAMADLRSILDLCKLHGTRVILYIHPMPADALEMLDLFGYWPIFENWKRELLRLVSDFSRQSTATEVAIWDFSDFDMYSTEPIRNDHRVLHWFWESFHYTRALGDLIVGRILASSDVHFGTRLTAEGLESHLAQIRESRQRYRANHKSDAERIRAVYDAETRVLKSSAMATR